MVDELVIVETAHAGVIENLMTFAKHFGYDVSAVICKGNSPKLKKVEEIADIIAKDARIVKSRGGSDAAGLIETAINEQWKEGGEL